MLAQVPSGRPVMRTRRCRWREGFIEVSKELAPTLMRRGGCFSSYYRWKEAVGADALMCVNFESDGRKPWMKDPNGNIRSAGPEEAAEWVDYCNNPESPGVAGSLPQFMPRPQPEEVERFAQFAR